MIDEGIIREWNKFKFQYGATNILGVEVATSEPK